MAAAAVMWVQLRRGTAGWGEGEGARGDVRPEVRAAEARRGRHGSMQAVCGGVESSLPPLSLLPHLRSAHVRRSDSRQMKPEARCRWRHVPQKGVHRRQLQLSFSEYKQV